MVITTLQAGLLSLFLTPLMLCVCFNFIHKCRDLQFKVNFERQIFWETFQCNFIYSQSFCQKSAERKSLKKYFFYFVFDVWPGDWTLALRLISQHTTQCHILIIFTEFNIESIRKRNRNNPRNRSIPFFNFVEYLSHLFCWNSFH